MPGNSAAVIRRRERQAKAIELRKNQHATLRAIAAANDCSIETARRDINGYLAKLDAACMENAAALRAELYETYDSVLQRLEAEVLENGALDRVPELLKTSAEIRRLYGIDIPQLGRTELAMRRAAVTELAARLKDRLAPETFAEVIAAITADGTTQLVDGVALAGDREAGIEPPQLCRSGPSAAQGPGEEGGDDWRCEPGSDLGPMPVVFDGS